MKTKKWIGILLMGAVVLTGCAKETVGGNTGKTTIMELEESQLDAPQKTEVLRGNMQIGNYYDAQVGPKVVQLKFPQEGLFGEYHVNLGDVVKEGDVLAVCASEELEKAIEEQEAALEHLTKTYEYERVDKEKEIAIKKLELEEIYKQLESLAYHTPAYTAACQRAGECDMAKGILELELKHLKQTYELELPYYQNKLKEMRRESTENIIKAPFDGVVVALQEMEYGGAVDSEMYYVAVADTTVTYARVEYVSDSVLNQMVGAVLWEDGEEYEVVAVPMEEDHYVELKNSGETMYSEFEIVNAGSGVEFGDFGKLKLIQEEKQNVLMIPETALQFSGGNYYAYKDVDGEPVRTIVKIGSKDGIRVEIKEGLEEGDLVYVQE